MVVPTTTLKDLPLHKLDCRWVFRLGECECEQKPKRKMLPKGTAVLAWLEPILAGWGSIGWWIVIDDRLWLVSSYLEDSFEELFGRT